MLGTAYRYNKRWRNMLRKRLNWLKKTCRITMPRSSSSKDPWTTTTKRSKQLSPLKRK